MRCLPSIHPRLLPVVPRALALPLAALALLAPAARAQITEVDTGFSGTINVGEIISLVGPGGTVNGPVTNNGSLWFNNPDIPSQTISSVISGSGDVIFFQPVTVTLSGANTFTGGAFVYGGTVTVSGSIAGGIGPLEVDGAAGTLLTISGSVTNGEATLAGTEDQAGDVTVSTGGSWSSGTLYAGFSGSSTVTISGGTVSSGTAYFGRQSGSQGDLVITSGSYAPSGIVYFGYQGSSSLTVTGGSLTAGSDMFVGYLGAGTASLSAGTLSAGTISVVGKLTVGKEALGSLTVNGGSLSSGSAVIGQTTSGNGTVTMNSGTWQVTNDLEVGSTVGGVGSLAIAGGSVTSRRGFVGNLAGSTGSVTVTSGTWTLSGDDPNGNLQVGHFGSGTLTVSGGSVTSAGATIGNNSSGNGTVVVNGGELAITGLTNIGFFATGALQLSSGTITTGQVVVGGQNHLSNLGTGSVTVTGGTWNSSLSLTVGQGGNGTYTQSGGLVTAAAGYIGSANTLATAGTGSVTVTGGTLAYGGNLDLGNEQAGSTGSGTLTIGGTGFVSVADTLSRATNGTLNLNSGGTLSIGIGGATGSLPTDVVDDGLLIFNRSTNYTYSNAISGSGAVDKLGAGTLTVTGANSYSGPTNVYGGTLSLVGQLGETELTVHGGASLIGSGTTLGSVAIDPNGTISPGIGSVATLTVGGYSMDGSTALAVMEITGSLTTEYDRVLNPASDPLTWGGGSLSFSMSGTTSYAEGTEFYLFSGFTSYSGAIAGISFNGSGTDFAGLGFADYGEGVWLTGYNFLSQRLKFDTTTGTLSVVPEPSVMLTAAVALGCGTAVAWRRRRGRRAAAGAAGR